MIVRNDWVLLRGLGETDCRRRQISRNTPEAADIGSTKFSLLRASVASLPRRAVSLYVNPE